MVFPYLEDWVRVGRGIPLSEGLHKFVTRHVCYSSE
jgi:hypothetical protein